MKCFGLAALPPGSGLELVPVPAGRACIDCGLAIVCGDVGFILPYVGGPDGEDEAFYHRGCLARCLGISLSPPSPSGPGDGSSSETSDPS